MINTKEFYEEKIEEFTKTCNSLYTLLKTKNSIEKRLKIEQLILQSEENINKYKKIFNENLSNKECKFIIII